MVLPVDVCSLLEVAFNAPCWLHFLPLKAGVKEVGEVMKEALDWWV